jgi:hypothetical protein
VVVDNQSLALVKKSNLNLADGFEPGCRRFESVRAHFDMKEYFGHQRRVFNPSSSNRRQTTSRFDNFAVGEVDRPQGDPEGVSAQRE